MSKAKRCEKCQGRGWVYLPATYPPRRTIDTVVLCVCKQRRRK